MNVLGLMFSIGAVTLSCAFPQMKGSCKIPPRLGLAELLEASEQESFPMGHVVRYACRPGYSRYGAAIRMICSEGRWLSVSKGECKKKRCGNPGDIDFGTFELKNEEDFVFGAIVEYSCELGYQMISKYNSIECTADGWSRDLPHCEAKLCPPVVDDSVRVLSTVHDEEYTAGHVINLECKNPNRKLNGPSQIHCTSDGTWNVDPPTCKANRCPPVVDDSLRVLSTMPDEEYTTGHVINLECKNPNKKLNGPSQIHCTSDGTWNIDLPTCKAKLCPPVVDDSVRVVSTVHDEQYTTGHVINLECKNPNKKLNGPSQIHCTSNGTWNVDPPTCKEQKRKKQPCFPPPEVLFGELIGRKKQMYDSGSTIEFKCVSYYKRQGKKEIKCRNGVWEQLPACLVPCILNSNYIKGNHTDLVNAKEKYVEHNKTVKFKCLQTFEISDAKLLNVKCLNGTLEYPTCVKMVPCILNSNYIKGNHTDLVNAKQKNVEHNTNVKFRCLRTFGISDAKLLNVKCLNGTLEYPTCVKMVPCILNSNYIKGNHTDLVNAKQKNVEHNKTVTFRCLQTFGISDAKLLNVKCLNGTLEYPTCVKMADEITVQPSVESEPHIY
ncbi:complement factor H-like isoform X2 [Rana temporaria]|uniref:complement factor H-like isoform X2 n=1 Tax=Rana temporaria TaxID=8407 RepID=UPI001AAC9C85|nr:complement factor H-like isoform X2 [Rana temporaria]